MNPDVEFHPAAEQELLDAEDWYAERSLIYRLHEERVQVVAVAHQSRRPGYWKDRV